MPEIEDVEDFKQWLKDLQELEDSCHHPEKHTPKHSHDDSCLKKTETVYTVPLHVGQNIEVPEGSKVTYY